MIAYNLQGSVTSTESSFILGSVPLLLLLHLSLDVIEGEKTKLELVHGDAVAEEVPLNSQPMLVQLVWFDLGLFGHYQLLSRLI